MELSLSLKQKLYQKVLSLIEDKINHEIRAIDEARSTANLETKSSMGDKYETGRAMMQIEQEKHGYQLQENMKIKKVLSQIASDEECVEVKPGALVCTNLGNFYFCVSVGEIPLSGFSCMTLSLASPIGKVFHHKKSGDSILFRNKSYQILSLI